MLCVNMHIYILIKHYFRRHTDGQCVSEKMLDITNHERNTNENHNEI